VVQTNNDVMSTGEKAAFFILHFSGTGGPRGQKRHRTIDNARIRKKTNIVKYYCNRGEKTSTLLENVEICMQSLPFSVRDTIVTRSVPAVGQSFFGILHGCVFQPDGITVGWDGSWSNNGAASLLPQGSPLSLARGGPVSNPNNMAMLSSRRFLFFFLPRRGRRVVPAAQRVTRMRGAPAFLGDGIYRA
jgi:hypothetical protein